MNVSKIRLQIILAWTRRHRIRDNKIRAAMEKNEQKNPSTPANTQGNSK